jgi:hypothetical protein
MRHRNEPSVTVSMPEFSCVAPFSWNTIASGNVLLGNMLRRLSHFYGLAYDST